MERSNGSGRRPGRAAAAGTAAATARGTAPAPVMEFHVSRAARDRYAFDEALFGLSGNVILADFGATRRCAQRTGGLRTSSR